MEGALPAVGISQVRLFWSDVLVRLAREKRLRMTDLEWHAQHRRAKSMCLCHPILIFSRVFPRLFLRGASTCLAMPFVS